MLSITYLFYLLEFTQKEGREKETAKINKSHMTEQKT